MARILAVANQKGGVGKTTTVINLGACLAEAGKRVLVIDLDPQGNTTSGFGVDKEAAENNIYDILLGEASFDEAVQREVYPKLDLVASDVELSGAEIELINREHKEYILRDALAPVRDKYDFILIDCPPALSMLTVNALTTADAVLVPIQCEYYALEGLSQLMYTINLVKERLNPELTIDGIVFTMFDGRNNLSLQVVRNVRDNLQEHVYKTLIPRNVRLAEAPSYGMPICAYEPKSTGAESYRMLAKEVIKNARKSK